MHLYNVLIFKISLAVRKYKIGEYPGTEHNQQKAVLQNWGQTRQTLRQTCA